MYRWNTGECTDGTRVMYKLLQKGGLRSSDNLSALSQIRGEPNIPLPTRHALT